MPVNQSSNQTSCQPTSDEILVVWVVAILTAIYLLPYLICIIHMAKDRKLLEKQPFYLLAVNLGVADIVQILFNGPGVMFLTLTCQDPKFGRTQFFLNSSIGAILNSAWEVGMSLIFCMAINRVISVYGGHTLSKTVFSRRNTQIYIVICWLYGSTWYMAYCIPGGPTIVYHFHYFCWYYDSSTISSYYEVVEFYVNIIVTVLMFVCYLTIMIKLKINGNRIMTAEAARINKYERTVLAQAFLICLDLLACVLTFFLVPTIARNNWAGFTANVTWIVGVGTNCVIYVFLNSTIRKKFTDLIKGRCVAVQITATPNAS